jgi:hypothetical protein
LGSSSLCSSGPSNPRRSLLRRLPFACCTSRSSPSDGILDFRSSEIQSPSFVSWIVVSCRRTSVGFCRSGLYGRGLLTGPEGDGGVTTRRPSDVPVTGLGSGRENSMSLSPCLHMAKSQFCMNDMNCPGPIHFRIFTGSRAARMRHGVRLFRPESHCSNVPAEVQVFGVSFRRSAF